MENNKIKEKEEFKKNVFKVPHGVEFIGACSNYALPEGQCIVDKGVTGCGYTEYCLTNKDNVLLCSPRKMLLKDKARQHLMDSNIIYLENNIKSDEDVLVFKDRIALHWCNCITSGLPCKFVITYDSCSYVVNFILENHLEKDFHVVVDEFQCIFLDAYFKASNEFDFVNVLQVLPNIIYLSATPMLDKYLKMTDEFKDLDYYYIDWSESGYIEDVLIRRKQVKSLTQECSEIVKEYLEGNFPTALDSDNNVHQSKEVVFYFNSVKDIVKVIKKMGLTPDNTLILCSDIKKNKIALNRIKFKIGEPSLKGEPNKMFTFCTSTVYVGVDFYSDNASSFVFANPNLKNLALDIMLDLPQIIGRQRDKSNLFKNDIKVFYKLTRGENLYDKALFDKIQEQRKIDSGIILNMFFKQISGIKEKELLSKKLLSDIIVSKYSGDMISIDKTGQPVYNKFVEIAHERAWEVIQEDYQSKISVTRALDKVDKFTVVEEEFKDEKDKIISDFLDNYFYKTGVFALKLKYYCEFMDKFGTDKYISDRIYYKIDNPKFRQFYNFYGTPGCKAKEYRENELDKGFQDNLSRDELKIEIDKRFKVGDRVTMIDIKKILSEIYRNLGINKSPKATDLSGYFHLSRTKIKNGKERINAFILKQL